MIERVMQMTTNAEVVINVQKIGTSEKIKESESNFTCPENTVMIGRIHHGDENAATQYVYGLLTLNDVVCTVFNVKESEWIKESQSVFICPENTVIIGREHTGDENGNTRYKYANVRLRIFTLVRANEQWSDWVKESDSDYISPPNTVMIGREHRGDENAKTRYRYANIVSL